MLKVVVPSDDTVQTKEAFCSATVAMTDFPNDNDRAPILNEDENYFSEDVCNEITSTPTSTPTTSGIRPDRPYRSVTVDSVASHDSLAAKVTGHRDHARTTNFRNCASIAILTLVNLLNYMDRYSVAGVLLQVQDYYSISKTQAGLLSTVFIVSYMILSPVFGFMGDRGNRKLIMSCGIAFWSVITLGSSFIGRDKFTLFLVMRGLVGVGEASYSTIAPTIIADLFNGNSRTRALSVFYFAIPVGSGLGYIVGSEMGSLTGQWQWALRVTPGLGIICSLLLLVILREQPRGAADDSITLEPTSWKSDVISIFKHKSFMLSSLGFTCVAFVAGALALWAPEYIYVSQLVQPNNSDDAMVSLLFGVVTCVAGFLGVGLGSGIASWLRKKTSQADPLVCAFGLLSSAPFLFLSLYMSRYNTTVTWICIFIGETFLCLNWALVSDMVLYLVIPTRRSTAEAVQILMSHALGDAGSPTIVGMISDAITRSYGHTDRMVDYQSLQFALYITCFVCVLGGAFFLAAALFIDADRTRTEMIMRGELNVNGGKLNSSSGEESTEENIGSRGIIM